MSSRDLTDEQNEAVRAVAERLMKERGWNRSQLGDEIGRSLAVVSRFLDKVNGTSLEVAKAIARLAGLDPLAMIDGRNERSTSLVHGLPGYVEAREALRDRFTPTVLDAATRALDAVGAEEVDEITLEAAARFAQDHMPRRRPETQAVGTTAAKLEAVKAEQRNGSRKRKAR